MLGHSSLSLPAVTSAPVAYGENTGPRFVVQWAFETGSNHDRTGTIVIDRFDPSPFPAYYLGGKRELAMRYTISVAFLACVLAGCASTPKQNSEEPPAEAQSPLAKLRAQEAALTADPDNAELHYQYGNTLYDLTKYAEAAVAYQHAIDRDPNHSRAYTNLGLCLRQLGQFEPAVMAYEKALELEPDEPATLRNLAYVCGLMGDFSRQYKYVRQLAELLPNDANAQADLLGILMRRQEYEGALPLCQRLVALEPSVAENHYVLGECLFSLSRYDEAEPAWNRVLELDPKHPSAMKGLAVLYWQKKDYDRAWAAVTRCRNEGVALDPLFIEALQNDSGRLAP